MKLSSRHYVLEGDDNKVVETDLLTWARWLENANRHVAWTQVTSQITVSTVFLGIDHRFDDKGPPLLFETMVFAPDHVKPEGGDWFWGNWMWRYSSWDDAETGHKAAVRRVRAAIGQKVDSAS